MFVVYRVVYGGDPKSGVKFHKIEAFRTLEEAGKKLEELMMNPKENESYTVMMEN